jgi:hypothetical protein
MNKKENDLLSSWKEIASYLDCDVRTAHRWEKEYGLPVHRLGKGVRTRVFAYEYELDTWLQKKASKDKTTNKHAFRVILFILIAVLAAASVFFVYHYLTFDRQPNDFDMEGSQLIVLNRDGRELWRKDFNIPFGFDEEYYRGRYQIKRQKDTKIYLPLIQFKDINCDGDKEVLFGMSGFPDGRFFCFSKRGDVLWEIQAGRELVFGTKTYTNEFNIGGFLSCDLEEDGFLEIVLCANQNTEFPTQLLLINHHGDILGEYWNSGRFGDFAFHDLNDDGRKEIIAGGMNNQYDSPVFMVFEPDEISGASPNSGEYACPSLPPGSEKFYVRLPFAKVCRMLNPIGKVTRIIHRSNGAWSFIAFPLNLDYRFNQQFYFQELRSSHHFERAFQEAKEKGIIAETSEEEYLEKLTQQILYYNGEKWVTERSLRNQR